MPQNLISVKTIDLMYRRLTRNSLLLIASNLFGALLNFCISILIGRNLGQAGLGRWVFLIAWASGLTMICEFGMSSLLTRKISNTPDFLNELLFSTLFIKSVLSIVAGGILWAASPYLGLDMQTSLGLHYVVFIVFCGLMYGSFAATFRALGLMMPILFINISSLFFQLSGTFWLLQRSSQVLPLIQWLTLTGVVQFGLSFTFWFWRLRRAGGKIRILIPSCILMLKESAPFAVAGITGAIQMRSNPILLGYLKGENVVGVFGSASRFTEAAKLIPSGMFDAAFPVFSREGHGIESQRLLFRQLSRAIFAYCFLVILPLMFFSNDIIKWTFGPEFASASPVLIWLGISLFPTLNNAVVEVYLYATGDEKFATRLGLIGLGVQVLSGLPLIYFYGATGAAIGVLLGEVAIWLPLKARLNNFM